MHEVLVNRLGGLSLPMKSVVGLTDRPYMTLDVYRGRKTTKQQQQQSHRYKSMLLLQGSSSGIYTCSLHLVDMSRHEQLNSVSLSLPGE